MSAIGDAIAEVQAAGDVADVLVSDAELAIVQLPSVRHHLARAGDSIAARLAPFVQATDRAAVDLALATTALSEALKTEEQRLIGWGRDL